MLDLSRKYLFQDLLIKLYLTASVVFVRPLGPLAWRLASDAILIPACQNEEISFALDHNLITTMTNIV